MDFESALLILQDGGIVKRLTPRAFPLMLQRNTPMVMNEAGHLVPLCFVVVADIDGDGEIRDGAPYSFTVAERAATDWEEFNPYWPGGNPTL